MSQPCFYAKTFRVSNLLIHLARHGRSAAGAPSLLTAVLCWAVLEGCKGRAMQDGGEYGLRGHMCNVCIRPRSRSLGKRQILGFKAVFRSCRDIDALIVLCQSSNQCCGPTRTISRSHPYLCTLLVRKDHRRWTGRSCTAPR